MARMSFAILRHAKIKSSTKGAAISHNHRLSEVEKININPAQKHLNRSFLGDGAKDRIDALLPPKMRKDAVVSVETLLTASPEFFDGLEKDREKLAKNPVFLAWVDQSLGWAKKEFGSNLVDAVLHMDESSPHIHILSVPLIDGRLCAKEVMARKELQRRQTEYFQAVKGFGLERGVPAEETKRRHIGLKEDAGSGGKAAQVQAQLDRAKADLLRLQKLSKEWSDKDLAKVRALEATITSKNAAFESLKAEAIALITPLRTEVKTMKTQITQLEAENAQLAKDLADAKKFAAIRSNYQAEKATGTPAHLIIPDAQVKNEPIEAPKTPVEAIPAQWADIPIATKMDAAYGTPVGVYGRQVVLHMGRGKHVMHTVPDGQPVPKLKQTEQEKGGVSR